MDNYQQDIKINPEALDVEWCRQAQTFFRYAEQTAKAHDRADRLKERLDVVDAGLGLKIRSSPASYGLEKVTEAGVQASILLNPERAAVAKEVADAVYELEVFQAAVRALDQKKAALENLVRLQGQQYFAGPSVPREIGAEWAKDKERESARNLVKEAMRGQQVPESAAGTKRKLNRQ